MSDEIKGTTIVAVKKDGKTAEKLRRQGVSIHQVLLDNDTYYALKSIDGLIITGPTGTNVNDVSVGLINNCIK